MGQERRPRPDRWCVALGCWSWHEAASALLRAGVSRAGGVEANPPGFGPRCVRNCGAAPAMNLVFISSSCSDRAELREGFRGKLQPRSVKIFAKMFDRRCAGYQQNIRRAMKQPCQRDLHWRRAHRCRNRIQPGRLQRSKSSQREERHVGYSPSGKFVDEHIILAVLNRTHPLCPPTDALLVPKLNFLTKIFVL
jgi:hypothetical protein